MVSFSEIKASNVLIDETTCPKTAVLIGGTSGVGKFTIKALVSTGLSTKIYLIGRRSLRTSTEAFIQEMHAVNANAYIIWTEGEVSLMREVARLSQEITANESSIDLLFMSAGFAPFGKRKETEEGLEVAGSLEYYSRMLFTLRLLPLLRKSTAPRVVSVLAGGKESASIDLDDISLRQPGNFSGFQAQVQYATMNSVFLDRLAEQNPGVTFLHTYPGWVNTGNMQRGQDAGTMTAFLFRYLVEPLSAPFCLSEEESGQRNLFQCASSTFGEKGSPWNGGLAMTSASDRDGRLYLVNGKCEATANTKTMTALREKAQDRVWSYTQETLQPYLQD